MTNKIKRQKKQIRTGQVMPLHSPPFGPPPFPMLKAELLMIEFETDHDEIKRITPKPFVPEGHNRLTAFIGECSQLSHSLNYLEAAIIQPVKYRKRSALTIPYIWTSTDTALVAGRELYGMPKFLCDHDTLHKSANEITGRLRRGGTLMMELSMVIDGECDPGELPLGSTFSFVRHIPSPDPDWPDIKQVVWAELSDFQVSECWKGRGHIRFVNPLSSGLDQLTPSKILGAWYGKFSWKLPWAKILEEYKV